MILVYKLVKDERSGDVIPKLVGDLPDESLLVGFGPGEYAIFEGSKSTADLEADSEIPSQFKYDRLAVVK